MERLEPVLKQKFWILLGIGILMTIVGWWMATGTMAATITSRTSEIKAAEGKVPSGEIPNDGWTAGLSAVNTQQEVAVKSASRILWERQRARMTWPETVAEFAWEKGYRGDIKIAGRENYRGAYHDDCFRVWETLMPFNRIDGSGIVDFGLAKLPRQQWLSAPPAAEMWNAQEDLWLLESLLRSIAEVNGGASSTRLDACIHVIEKLTLHGGQPAGQRTLATPGGSGGGATAGAEMMTAGFGGGNFGGSGGGGGSTAVSADFDVKEEFGDDGGGAGGQGAMATSMAATGVGGLGATVASAKRYIDEDASLPFKTRGFYMTLIMDHRKIPNLIAELSASEKSAWPIEIVRVQYVRLHEDDTGGGGAVGGYNPSMAGGESSFSGAGSPGSFGESSFGAAAAPTFSIEGNAGGAGGPTSQSQVAIAALMNAVQDPNMARVAICGIITLYNEVKPEEAATTPASTPSGTPAPTADKSMAPETQTSDGTTPVSDADAAAESKPSASVEGEPATPDSKPSPTPEATPKKDETPSTPPETKPAETP
ncbi:MAG: hypothetical protein IAG10_25850 [Planctomycetaceae bacterium]|nr:hypothetical protein [Planctomycetaceae bacterium]